MQAQIIDKDFPVVAEATARLYGQRPTIALHKGFANYVCLKSLVDSTARILNIEERSLTGLGVTDQLTTLRDKLKEQALFAHMAGADIDLYDWAFEQGLTDGTGDKSTYDGVLEAGSGRGSSWSEVSLSSEDCIGSNCPFRFQCLPHKAREAAATADVIVTNHALLGVQAAHQVPVVIGSTALGPIDNMVIDEAHALPGWVRSQGATRISGPALQSLASAFAKTIELDAAMTLHVKRLDALLGLLKADLNAAAAASPTKRQQRSRGDVEETLEVPDKDLLVRSGDELESWCATTETLLRAILTRIHEGDRAWLSINRLANRAGALKDGIETLRTPSAHLARWLSVTPDVKHPLSGPVLTLQSSPVDVSPLLRGNLFSAQVDAATQYEVLRAEELDDDGEKHQVRRTLGVAAISATIPLAFGSQIGLTAQSQSFESPFSEAYSRSVAFVPTIDDVEFEALISSYGRGMNTGLPHQQWAGGHIVELVRANGGSALVLAATAANGRAYAQRLRTELTSSGITVYSQWDGLELRGQVAAWRADESSVLVGTR